MKQFLLSLLFLVPALVWGQFGKQRVISTEIMFPHSIVAADLDGDGDLDIISASSGNGEDKLVWFPNDGSGNFINLRIISTSVPDVEIIVAEDINKDGTIDLIVGSSIDSTLSWFANDGLGNFSEEKIISRVLRGIRTLDVGDIDLDGDLDLVSAPSTGLSAPVYRFLNVGQTNFEQKNLFTQEGLLSMISLADLDGDGDLDIIVASILDEGLYRYMNDGSGNFSNGILIDEEEEIVFIDTRDLDEDGDVDIIFADNNAPSVGWFENKENGTFWEKHPISTQVNNPYFIHIDDLDNDNDLDISCVSRNDGELVWFENIGQSNFSEAIVISKDLERPFSVYAADLDGDGYKDLMTASQDDSKIAWYENLINNPTISGTAFYDENSNGTFDEDEAVLQNISVTLEPEALGTYTAPNGTFNFYVPNGTYTLTAQPDSCWQLTTDSISYNITVAGEPVLNRNFGFKPASDYTHVQPRLTSAPTRCGFEVPFWLSIENDGCQPIAGQYALILSDLVTYINAEIEPDAIVGDTLFWNYERLIPSRIEQIKLNLQVAGTDFIGDTIRLQALAFTDDGLGNQVLLENYDFTSEIRCAYDPNDKLVKPSRTDEYEQNYTLFDETIEYTIRFQNTGNDTAFTVVLKDYLDENLDWTTFRPITASHPYEVFLYKDGLVEFTFENILLPDSTTNEPLSHGFVMFKINASKDLPENTIIENKVDIFFDFNPPIKTNTTTSVLVSELPKTTSAFAVSENLSVNIFPNPFHDQLHIEITSNVFESYQFILLDAMGRRVRSELIRDQVNTIQMQDLSGGMYFYQLLDRAGGRIVAGKLIKK